MKALHFLLAWKDGVEGKKKWGRGGSVLGDRGLSVFREVQSAEQPRSGLQLIPNLCMCSAFQLTEQLTVQIFHTV